MIIKNLRLNVQKRSTDINNIILGYPLVFNKWTS